MSLLFSKYGQFATSLRKEGGTGLGLYISRGIVDSHSGKIWLDSKPKAGLPAGRQGTTVTFEIPLVKKLDPVQVQISAAPVPAQKVVN
jgi:signal transduction histidine kinase